MDKVGDSPSVAATTVVVETHDVTQLGAVVAVQRLTEEAVLVRRLALR